MFIRPVITALFLFTVCTLSSLAESKGGVPRVTVAYLLDLQGEATIGRGDVNFKASQVCTELQEQDMITLGTLSSAQVFYKDRIVHIKYPENHQVKQHDMESRLKKMTETVNAPKPGEVEKKSQLIRSFTLDMLQVEPVSFVRKPGAIFVMAPGIREMNLAPDIYLANEKSLQVKLSLLEFSGRRKKLLGAIETSKTLLRWSETGWPRLKPDGLYQLRLEYIDEKGNDSQSLHSFSTLSSAERLSLEDYICNETDGFTKESAKNLTRALILLKNDCVGNAWSGIYGLLEHDATEPVLVKLAKRCRDRLMRNND